MEKHLQPNARGHP